MPECVHLGCLRSGAARVRALRSCVLSGRGFTNGCPRRGIDSYVSFYGGIYYLLDKLIGLLGCQLLVSHSDTRPFHDLARSRRYIFTSMIALMPTP